MSTIYKSVVGILLSSRNGKAFWIEGCIHGLFPSRFTTLDNNRTERRASYRERGNKSSEGSEMARILQIDVWGYWAKSLMLEPLIRLFY